MEYSWSKPLRDSDSPQRSKRRKKRLPATSQMNMLSPENDRVSKSFEVKRHGPINKGLPLNVRVQMLSPEDDRVSKSLDVKRSGPLIKGKRDPAALDLAKGGGSVGDNRLEGQSSKHHEKEHTQKQNSDEDSAWLGESSMESIGNESLDERSVKSFEGTNDSAEEGGSAMYDSQEEAGSVVSIKDLLDRKKEELSEVEAKYNDVKRGKVKPPKREKKKKVNAVPAVIVANAILNEQLASELSTLRATLNLHSLTNQCGDHLNEVWGLDAETRKPLISRIPSSVSSA